MLTSVHDCAKKEICWLCGEELKLKEKRVFMLCQLKEAFVSAYANHSDPRRNAFSDSVTDATNLYEWWSAFMSVEGSESKFQERLTARPALDLMSSIVVVCQRSSSSCSNLYAMITASKETIDELDPIRRKIAEEDEASRTSPDTSHIYQPQFLGSNTGRFSTGIRYRPYSIEHWNYIIANSRSVEGWMTKKSHDYFSIFRKWQRRYFVLDIERKTLSYFKDATKIQHRGTYQLGNIVKAVTLPDGNLLRDNPFQLEIHGRTQTGRQSVLLAYLESLQSVDFWFSCLRRTIRGEHYKILEMKNWLIAMNKIQTKCNETLDLLNENFNVAIESASSYPSQSMTSLSMQSQSYLASGELSSLSGITSTKEALVQQRMKIENCKHLVEKLEPIFLRVLAKICEDEYCGVDLEFAAAQKPVVQAALQFIILLQNSCLSDASCGAKRLFGEQWSRNLDLAYQLLNLTPKSLLHVHVRDMRVNSPDTTREESDKFEIPYVYDLALHDIVTL